MENILITGGAGFIGSAFVRRAVSEGFGVCNIDKLTYAGDLENVSECARATNYRFFHEDICNKDSVLQIVLNAQPDVIVHMAAESHVDRSIDCPEEFVKTNVLGTHVMLECALEYRHKNEDLLFLHVSTDEVFGSLGKEGCFDENSKYKPNSPYSASKAASDFLVKAYSNTYGLKTIIVNASNNYGPCQFPEKLLPLVVLNAINRRPLPIYGDGAQVRDWLYVDDHIDALFALINCGKRGESYCIGGGNQQKNIDVVKQICYLLGEVCDLSFDYQSLITYVKDRPGHDLRYATDASKLKDHTGWAAKTPFGDGLRRTVLWYIENRIRLSKIDRKRAGLNA